MPWNRINDGKRWLTPNAKISSNSKAFGNKSKSDSGRQVSAFFGDPQQAQCISSSQCASGFACVGGKCIKQIPSNRNNAISGCGDTTNEPTKARGCARGSGPNVKECTIPGCSSGDCNPNEICTGTLSVCRFSEEEGRVICTCSTDDGGNSDGGGGAGGGGGGGGGGRCTQFCDEYQAAIGSTLDGCRGRTCSECATCNAGTCKPNDCGGPCWCSRSCLGPCEYCGQDGVVKRDYNNCKTCRTTRNKDCPCGTVSKTCCSNSAEPPPCDIDCNEECDIPTQNNSGGDGGEPFDECAGTTESGYQCYPTGGCSPTGGPSSGGGFTYEKTGCITDGSQSCYLYNKTDYNDLPDKCYECNCPEGHACITEDNGLTKRCEPYRVRYGVHLDLVPPDIFCTTCDTNFRVSYDSPGYIDSQISCCVCSVFIFCGACARYESCGTYHYYIYNGLEDKHYRVKSATVQWKQYQIQSFPLEIWRDFDGFDPYTL